MINDDKPTSEDHHLQVIREIAHELRTPLTVMSGFSDLALRRAQRDPDIFGDLEEDLAEISLAGQRLALLIDLMVEDERSRNEPPHLLASTDVPIDVLMEQVVGEVGRRADVALVQLGAFDREIVRVDASAVARALASLVVAALADTLPPMRIETARADDATLHISFISGGRGRTATVSMARRLGVASAVAVIDHSGGSVVFGDDPVVAVRLPLASQP